MHKESIVWGYTEDQSYAGMMHVQGMYVRAYELPHAYSGVCVMQVCNVCVHLEDQMGTQCI